MVFFERLGLGIDQLQALDLSTGRVRWQQNMNDVLGRSAARDSVLYFTKGLGKTSYVIAGTRDGALLWYEGFQGASNSQFNHLALDTDMIFVAGNSLNAFSLKDGKGLWVVPNLAGLQQPVVFEDTVLVRDDRLLYAFDKHSGVEIGRLSLELAPGRSNVELNPAVFGDLVLIPVGKTKLAAYRLKMP
jgi:hypothetical protein